jgi:hypothetical protein
MEPPPHLRLPCEYCAGGAAAPLGPSPPVPPGRACVCRSRRAGCGREAWALLCFFQSFCPEVLRRREGAQGLARTRLFSNAVCSANPQRRSFAMWRLPSGERHGRKSRYQESVCTDYRSRHPNSEPCRFGIPNLQRAGECRMLESAGLRVSVHGNSDPAEFLAIVRPLLGGVPNRVVPNLDGDYGNALSWMTRPRLLRPPRRAAPAHQDHPQVVSAALRLESWPRTS